MVTSAAWANDIVGIWTITSEGRRALQESTLPVTDAGALKGTITGPRGNTMEIAEVKTSGADFTFRTNLSTRMGDFTLTYKGKVKGDNMAGTIDTPMGSNKFTGKRKAEE